MVKCGCGHSPENCTCKPSCKCGCNVRKSLAFERHAAYLGQAWRTLQDSVLLKREDYFAECEKCHMTFDSWPAHRDHINEGCSAR